ncbi:hypothetical protein Pcinc_036051 [Petrolisthes cinctipes]|uniref:C2H2-type domain-containing protein n=1 Tax=Petrolisthes cinctipes TaxID=88211 RepID=A0AAE1BVB2_PETCI|nr:hypothetical protein Pcinc_036051 [Petrolisthes cinctipes]
MNEGEWHRDRQPWMDQQNYNSRNKDFSINENQRLAALYGKGVVMVTQQEDPPEKSLYMYYCKVCCVDICDQRSLERHCSYQHHIENKISWERNAGHNDYESRIFEGRMVTQEDHWGGRGRSHKPNQQDVGWEKEYCDYYNLDNTTDMNRADQDGNRTGGSCSSLIVPVLPSAQHIIDLARSNIPPPRDGLFDGQIGKLLKELAGCSVKDEVDAVVSTEVILAILKLLKGFMKNIKCGISTLQMRLILDETVVKVHMVKSLLEEESAARQVDPSVPRPNQSFKRSGEDDDYPSIQDRPKPRKALKPRDRKLSVDY